MGPVEYWINAICSRQSASESGSAGTAPSASAGSAVIPGLGVLVMGGHGEAQRQATAWDT